MRSFALTYVRTTHPQTDFRRWGTRGRHPFPGQHSELEGARRSHSCAAKRFC